MSATVDPYPVLQSAKIHDKALILTWNDGKASTFHFLWLRDNCPTTLHSDTQERIFDLLSVTPNIHPVAYRVENERLTIDWSEGDHQSYYSGEWLRAHAYSGDLKPVNRPRAQSWDATFVNHHGSVSYDQLMADDEVLHRWMTQLDRDGLTLVKGLPATTQALDDVAQRIDYQRQTNFGKTFEVRSEPNPINLAYTAMALPLHTDLPNQETPPGYQFLHCLANDTEGGESVFADGLKVLEDLRDEALQHFELLATVAVPFRFHDDEHDIQYHHPMINLDHQGNIIELKYNAHLAAVFDLPEAIMHDYYLAYRDLMGRLRAPQYQVQFRLETGEMAVFDNRRVLHGRTSFAPTGHRHLRGCYVDRTEFQSRLRVLEAKYGSLRDALC